jgi:hypothetical protein
MSSQILLTSPFYVTVCLSSHLPLILAHQFYSNLRVFNYCYPFLQLIQITVKNMQRKAVCFHPVQEVHSRRIHRLPKNFISFFRHNISLLPNGFGLDLPPGFLGGHGPRPCWTFLLTLITVSKYASFIDMMVQMNQIVKFEKSIL